MRIQNVTIKKNIGLIIFQSAKMNILDRFYEDYRQISGQGSEPVAVVFVSPECAEQLDKISVVGKFQQAKGSNLFAPLQHFAVTVVEEKQASGKAALEPKVFCICYQLLPNSVRVQIDSTLSDDSKNSVLIRDFQAIFCNSGNVNQGKKHARHEFQMFLDNILQKCHFLYLMKKIEQ